MRKLTISIGASKTSVNWLPLELSWEEFLKRFFLKPQRKRHNVKEYHSATKIEQGQFKDGSAFVGGKIEGNRRNKVSIEYRDVMCLDLDYSLSFDNTLKLLKEKCNFTWVLVSTHSHTPEKPKFRLIIPLKESFGYTQYVQTSNDLMKKIDISLFDTTCDQHDRLMYFPSLPSNGEYCFYENKSQEWLDNYLNLAFDRFTYQNLANTKTDTTNLLPDPAEKGGIIGAFCACYPFPDVLDKFLSHVYEPCIDKPDRYTYLNGSAPAGLQYFSSNYCYAYDFTDPAQQEQHALNAFDIVRIHLFAGDFDKMTNFVLNKKECKARYDMEMASKDFNAEVEEETQLEKFTPKEGKFLDLVKFTEMILQRYQGLRLCKFNEDIYSYVKGYYEIIDPTKIEKLAYDHLINKYNTSTKRKEILKNIQLSIPTRKDFNKHDCTIVFKNITLVDLKPLEHHYKDYFTLKINHNYDENAKSKLWDIFLDQVLDKNSHAIFQEMFGYALTTSVKGKAFFFITGEGNSGKSLALEILEHIIGANQTSQISFADICNHERFATGGLVGKLLNVNKEQDLDFLKDSGTIKQLTGDNNFQAEQKFKNAIVVKNTATHIFVNNEIPRIRKLDKAYYDRVRIIKFKGSIPKEQRDKNLKEKLISEDNIEGIVKWAVEGLKRLVKNNYEFSDLDGQQEKQVEALLIESNLPISFVNECCVLIQKSKTRNDFLYASFRQWCYSLGIQNNRIPTRTRFIKDVRKHFKLEGKVIKENTECHRATFGLEIITQYQQL